MFEVPREYEVLGGSSENTMRMYNQGNDEVGNPDDLWIILITHYYLGGDHAPVRHQTEPRGEQRGEF